MDARKIHFIYDEKKEPEASFAKDLIQHLGQHSLEDATNVVTVGGDGLLVHAFPRAAGKPIAGVIAPGSNSRGFWTNKGIRNPDDLRTMLDIAKVYPVRPLQADISFADHTSVTRYGYNDISVQRVHQELPPETRREFDLTEIDVGVQSMLINLRVAFANAVLGPIRLMGSGIILATPFGSTAMNRKYGGPSVDIRSNVIIMTEMGTSDPERGYEPIVNDSDRVFHIEVQSVKKRPVMVTYDSFGVVRNEDESPIKEVRISLAQTETANLMLNDDPGLRAYSALLP